MKPSPSERYNDHQGINEKALKSFLENSWDSRDQNTNLNSINDDRLQLHSLPL